MANLPNSVMIQEVGPRDGLQIESRCLNIDQKVAMIRALVDAGLREIEIGSFVNPKAIPQMAGTAEVLDRLPDKQGVNYRALWLNTKGLEQAVAARRIAMDGKLTPMPRHSSFNASSVWQWRLQPPTCARNWSRC
jgi:hydroxymethylglutaryl-CoA lyase